MELFINKNKKVVIVFSLFLVSYFQEILFDVFKISWLELLPLVKLALILLLFFILIIYRAEAYLKKFVLAIFILLLLMNFSHILTSSNILNVFFNTESLWGGLANNIFPKLISSIILLVFLIIILKKTSYSYIKFGNPKVMVSEIKFLGIKDNEINWGKLSLISGLLIGFGTSALTILTVIGQLSQLNISFLISSIPIILVLALINSFSEGLFYRSTIISTLDGIIVKDEIILLSAIVFGSFHYHGAPGGIIGVVMSTVLGWFLAKSVYETKGMLCGWFIHFCQDVVIFSTIALMGAF